MRLRSAFYLICCSAIIWMGEARGQSGFPAARTVIRVYDTRCQSLENPVGIGESLPSFSWKLSSGQRGLMQTACQIVVASTAARLEKDPDIWNSGKMPSGQNSFVRYSGKALRSATKYFWKVRIWTNQGKAGTWSSPASFVTALLNEGDWNNTKWIGYEALPDSLKVFPGVHGNGDGLGNKAVKRAVIPYFRKDFPVGKKISQALIYASGLGQYALYLNGKRVDSSGFLNPAWSDYAKRCYYNSYDVTALLKNGKNTLGAIAGTGFLYINRERYRKLVIAEGYPMIRLKMVIRYTDGSSEDIGTDRTWKTAPSAITYSSIYGGEDFDANKIPSGWNTPSFADAAWRQAAVVRSPGGSMQAQEDDPVAITRVFRPVHINASKSDLRVYDFGQNASGIVRLKISGPKGYRIRIIPAELLNSDGSPDQNATGKPYHWEYTLSGKRMESWQPLFSYYGFRYAGIEVFDSNGKRVNTDVLHLHSLLSLHTRNNAPPVGSFSCSGTLFNHIFSLIRWGIQNNLSNVATDCPHREKLGWLEQTHLMGNSIQYNYDILSFYSKIAGDMRDAQLPDGMIPDIAPEYVEFAGGFRDSPEWGSASVLVPWYLYRWYGDTATLAENYAMMKRYEDYLDSKARHHLLAYGLGDWFDLGPNSPGVSQLTPLGVTATAFYYYNADILHKTAAVLGKPADERRYGILADSIRDAFNKKYFDTATKVYATGSQASFAMPLYFGIAPQRYRKQVLANLTDSIATHNNALTAGDIGFRYLVQALEQGGEDQLIYRMNNREDVPGYGYQIRKGATALTESWQALREVSNDHMMLGHLMEWLYSGLGGIRQQEGSAGYKHILIAPQFVRGINGVTASYHSINGLISVKWKRLPGGLMRLQVEVPGNTDAKIILPAADPEQISEGGKPLGTVERSGIRNVVSGKKETVITAGSGKYVFNFKSGR